MNKKTQVYSWIAFWRMRVKNQTNTRVWEASSLCPETSTKNAVQELHLWGLLVFFSVSKFKTKVISPLPHILLSFLSVVSHPTKLSPRPPRCLTAYSASLPVVSHPTELPSPQSLALLSFLLVVSQPFQIPSTENFYHAKVNFPWYQNLWH